MTTTFELKIEGEIPEGNTDLGPEAQVATKAKVAALVEELTGMGLINVVGTRRLPKRTGPREAKVAPPPSAHEATTAAVAAELTGISHGMPGGPPDPAPADTRTRSHGLHRPIAAE